MGGGGRVHFWKGVVCGPEDGRRLRGVVRGGFGRTQVGTESRKCEPRKETDPTDIKRSRRKSTEELCV